eukprot:10817751-Prorocentrum_lima.AAC.1
MKWTESLGRPCWRSRGAHSPGGRELPKSSSRGALVNAEETSTNNSPQEWERWLQTSTHMRVVSRGSE